MAVGMLVPEKRVDKNGVLGTRWVKALVGKSNAILNAPKVAKASAAKSSQEVNRIAMLREMFGGTREHFRSHRIRDAFEEYSPEALSVIDKVISRSPEMAPRERSVLCAMIASAETYNEELMLEGFRLSEAFCSPYATRRNLKLLEPLEYILGVRDDYIAPLDLDDEKVRQEAIALVRYAYEMHFRNHADIEPHTIITYSPDHQMLARNYSEKPMLKELVREYPERVEELIDLSLKHETSDPVLLRSLFEHEGPTALNSGWL